MSSSKLELITPQKAQQYLATSNRNRTISPAHVAKLRRDIDNGTFYTSHQGIAFDTNGCLVDGQHRLTAITQSGKSVEMMVYRGLTSDALRVTDTGRLRSRPDAWRITRGIEVSTTTIAATHVLMKAPKLNGVNTCTDDELLEFLLLHKDAIDFGLSCKINKNPHALLVGVCARAFYHSTEEQRDRMRTLIATGACDSHSPGDVSLIKVRDMFMAVSGRYGGGGSIRMAIYQKAQNGIWHFLAGKPLKALYGSADDLLPLPS